MAQNEERAQGTSQSLQTAGHSHSKQMSSFKRNLKPSNSKQSTSSYPTGFHPSHYNGIPTASTGIASLDDLLGGGLPISSSFLIDEDQHGGYAKLMLRYSIAQGIVSNQNLIVIGSSIEEGGGPKKIIERLMSLDQSDEPEDLSSSDNLKLSTEGSSATTSSDYQKQNITSDAVDQRDEDEDDEENADKVKSQRMKIAWRYENLGHHHAESESIYQQSRCHSFNLSKTMRLSTEQRSRIDCIDVNELEKENLLSTLLLQIQKIIDQKRDKTLSSSPPSFRIVIQSIGSIGWPLMKDFMIFRFFKDLEGLLQVTDSPRIAIISFPSTYRSSDLAKILPWATSASLSLQSFTGDEKSQVAFPNHQGAVHFTRLPSPSSLSPPATKLSVIRSLGGSSESGIGSNLGFKLGRRKGFRIEMMGLGLDLESQNPTEEDHLPTTTHHHLDTTPSSSAPQVSINVQNQLSTPSIKAKSSKPKPRVRFGDPSSHDNLKNTDW
ncbi:hypothetical protein Pst134EB_008359 [Puccinia striiformis f. sp. tritici]|uniref:Elongator complex protein 4 n=1 Tax=Puccinia striiformis f. sp. tritici PST-78 TaxID=1165861 RepID=A0A0L0VPY7_9BASI|nr:hypothetical protein Pst134EB_008359 [Puccinia striiformis f. sp. tritici]KNF01055.1 hypothetical protein PSTG_05686 [Puccinia striiformis f. sp. tritici PST-78]